MNQQKKKIANNINISESTKSDGDVMFCLQLFSKTLTCVSLTLKIKHNDWLLADTFPQPANHSALLRGQI